MVDALSRQDDRIRLSVSKTRHDLRVSLVILIVGIGLTLFFYGLGQRILLTQGDSPLIVYPVLIADWAGFLFLIVGAIFSGINWSYLRKADRTA